MLSDREQKLHNLISTYSGTPEGIRLLTSALQASGYSMLRQVESMTFPEVTDPERVENALDGIFGDTETTGTDTDKDKVIQVAMRKFKYDEKGIISLGEVFNRFNDPGIPIPPEVTNLTRITDEHVRGQRIHDEELAAFTEGAETVIFHNAAFDRKMMERNFRGAGFQDKRIDCSLAQVDWLQRGHNGRSLELLALQAGYVYGSHNALNDINVMPYILQREFGERGNAFSEMIRRGNAGQILLIAKNAHYDVKDHLKARGYKWSGDGSEAAGHKAWWTVLEDDPEKNALEAEFLRDVIYKKDVSLPAFRLSPTERYSTREPKEQMTFRTAEINSVAEAMAQRPTPREEQSAFSF